MIRILFDLAKSPLKLFIMAIGIMALYAYLTHKDMNIVVSDFIELLKPIKDSLLEAAKTLLPIMYDGLINLFNSF